jgi:hypothetical protein
MLQHNHLMFTSCLVGRPLRRHKWRHVACRANTSHRHTHIRSYTDIARINGSAAHACEQPSRCSSRCNRGVIGGSKARVT